MAGMCPCPCVVTLVLPLCQQLWLLCFGCLHVPIRPEKHQTRSPWLPQLAFKGRDEPKPLEMALSVLTAFSPTERC